MNYGYIWRSWVALEHNNDLLIYQIEVVKTKIDVKLENETVWMTQKAIAKLYQTTPQNITFQMKNIYEEGELIFNIDVLFQHHLAKTSYITSFFGVKKTIRNVISLIVNQILYY